MSNIRARYTDEEIRHAWRLADWSVADTAKHLSALGKGEVSRQLARHWLMGLGLHRPKTEAVTQHNGPRVLLIDIETSPITGYVWGLFKQNVGLNQIKAEWNILSFCAKWLGEPEIIYDDVRDHPADDSTLLQQLWDLLNEADLVICQNGKRFDVPKIQARLIMAGYLPPSPFKVVDTMLMAKQQFGFTSKKLEWMTTYLTETKKDKHAKFPGFELWSECLKGNPDAWDEMREYNIPDVTSMEELYLKLRPWYVGHPNVAIYCNSEQAACPKCGSHDVQQDGWTYTQSGKYERYHCGNCGGWSRGRYTRNSTAVRKAQLSN